jgi:hypothetical protein
MIELRALAQLARAPVLLPEAARCELCTAPLAERHDHVVELGRRGVSCACQACAILFADSEPGARYRTVPDRVLVDRDVALVSEQLGMPVGLAFCVRDSTRDQVVVGYPGAAGIVDAELDPAAWTALVAATPLAAALAPDVEALLLRREPGSPRITCYLVPISAAYDLAGQLRSSWRGFTGGDEARARLAQFFATLEQRGGRP